MEIETHTNCITDLTQEIVRFDNDNNNNNNNSSNNNNNNIFRDRIPRNKIIDISPSVIDTEDDGECIHLDVSDFGLAQIADFENGIMSAFVQIEDPKTHDVIYEYSERFIPTSSINNITRDPISFLKQYEDGVRTMEIACPYIPFQNPIYASSDHRLRVILTVYNHAFKFMAVIFSSQINLLGGKPRQNVVVPQIIQKNVIHMPQATNSDNLYYPSESNEVVEVKNNKRKTSCQDMDGDNDNLTSNYDEEKKKLVKTDNIRTTAIPREFQIEILNNIEHDYPYRKDESLVDLKDCAVLTLERYGNTILPTFDIPEIYIVKDIKICMSFHILIGSLQKIWRDIEEFNNACNQTLYQRQDNEGEVENDIYS